MKKRLFIASNRLPLTIEKADNAYICRISSGGLISSINSYLKDKQADDAFSDTIWVGAPGCSEKVWNYVSSDFTASEYAYSPVFINWKKYELYYNGLSNSLIWPLFHYFPSYAEYDDNYFTAYMDVNMLFADVIAKQVQNNDTVWIHDYHLLPLAGILREKFPTLTIGLFLHIPFPSYELFRVIPKKWQRELLSGMLGSDLIGFHTIDYAEHFRSCVSRILHAEQEGPYILWANRHVKVDAFPISIDYKMFHDSYDCKSIVELRDKYEKLKAGKRMIFSIDRLDYTKGLSNRLIAYEQFLKENPHYKEKVIFVLTIIPSRDGISKYAERKRAIDEYIGNLNSRLGNIGWQPVIYYYNHLNFEDLIALYTSCDLALITPLRDGMNLVSKEFVASRKDKRGVLVLSEMAGSATELTEALLINPNDTSEIAEMIKCGLEMETIEQSKRLLVMQEKIKNYDVSTWAKDFLSQVKEVKSIQLEFEIKFLDAITKIDMLNAYASATRRLFLLDYDGSLIPFSKDPLLAAPEPKLLQILHALGENPQNDVFIISGRTAHILDNWFGHLPVGLVAEHGAKMKPVNGTWIVVEKALDREWMNEIEKIMDSYVIKCPNSFTEKKEYSIAWHYRNADMILGNVRAADLVSDLHKKMGNLSINILKGNKVIEARVKGINKGTATEKILSEADYDFIYSIGDDITDEDMFRKLAKMLAAFTIKIGNEASFAKYNLPTPHSAQDLLHTLSMYNKKQFGKLIV